MIDKKHWYDGFFYSTFIDSGGSKLRRKISNLIPKGSNVLDVACGTGALVFQLAEKCERVIGVELSRKMIEFAKGRNEFDNVLFYHMSGAGLSKKFKKDEFDYAIISFALHEMKPEDRIKVLKSMKRVAKNLIIVDFSAPLPSGFHSNMIRLVEFLAGKEHYNNHKSFIKLGGVKHLLKKAGITTLKELFADSTKTSKIHVCK